MAVKNALAALEEADDIGMRTKKKMEAQTKQMEGMDADLDKINENLDETEAIIDELEVGPGSVMGMIGGDVASKAGGWMGFGGGGAKQGQASASAMKVDTASSGPVKEGWLEKRGPMFGYAWERRWCGLYKTGLVWYNDEGKGEKKGDMDVKKGTKTYSFLKNKAPGDAIKHRGEKPYGFVVDQSPNEKGSARRLFYFDSPTKETTQEWIDAIDKVARSQKKKEKNADDTEMDQVLNALDNLEDTARNLGDEAKKQAAMVPGLTSKVEANTIRLDAQNERLKKVGPS